jgi:hypothetical protein
MEPQGATVIFAAQVLSKAVAAAYQPEEHTLVLAVETVAMPVHLAHATPLVVAAVLVVILETVALEPTPMETTLALRERVAVVAAAALLVTAAENLRAEWGFMVKGLMELEGWVTEAVPAVASVKAALTAIRGLQPVIFPMAPEVLRVVALGEAMLEAQEQ